jgi:hypothetical protein
MATICCCPPESEPAGCDSFSVQRGEQRADMFERASAFEPRRAQVAAELQVLAHRHLGEQAPPLGHQRDALRAEAVRRQARDVLPLEAHAPGADAVQPATALISVLLPALLGPTMHSSSPLPTESDTSHSAVACP